MVWTQLEHEIYHNALAGRPTHCNREAVKGAFIRALMLDLDYAGDPEATVQSLVPYPKDHTSGKRTRLPMTGVRLSNATIIGKIDLRDGAKDGGDLLPALELVRCTLNGNGQFDKAEDIPDEDRPAFAHEDGLPPAKGDEIPLRMTCLDISHSRLARLSLGHSRFSYINAFEALIDGPVDLQGVGPLDDWEDTPWPRTGKDEIGKWFEQARQETETRIGALVNKQPPDLRDTSAEPLLQQPEAPPEMEKKTEASRRLCHANFGGARIDGEVNLSDGHFRSLDDPWPMILDQAEINGNLNLSEAAVEGGISMDAAHIHGDCWMDNMTLLGAYTVSKDAQGKRQLQQFYQCFRAQATHFYGVLSIKNSHLIGEVWCLAAIVEVGLELTGSVIDAQGDTGINLNAIRAFRIRANDMKVLGQFLIGGATIQKECTFDSGFFSGPYGKAIDMQSANIGGEVSFKNTYIRGQLDLSSGQVGGNLDLTSLTIDGEARLLAEYSKLPDLDEFLVEFNAQTPEERDRLLLESDTATPELLWRKKMWEGRGREFVAFIANNVTVSEDFIGYNADILGTVRIFSAIIGKDVSIVSCRFACQDFGIGKDTALYLKDASIAGKLTFGNNRLYGDINLAGTRCDSLNELDGYAYGSEATRINLDGFTYQRLETPEYTAPGMKLNMHKAGFNRKAWLKRMPPESTATQPYIQLYRTLVLQGHLEDGREVRIMKFDRDNGLRRNSGPIGLLGNGLVWLYGRCFGYGLKPNRAAATLIISLLAGWGFVSYLDYRNALIVDQQPVAGYVSTSGGGSTRQLGAMSISHVDNKVPCGDNINTFLYALDVFVPLIDLHQESRCEVDLAADVATRTPPLWRQTLPSPRLSILPSVKLSWVPFEISEISVLQLVKSLYALLGWVITSLAVVTFSGILQRKDDDL